MKFSIYEVGVVLYLIIYDKVRKKGAALKIAKFWSKGNRTGSQSNTTRFKNMLENSADVKLKDGRYVLNPKGRSAKMLAIPGFKEKIKIVVKNNTDRFREIFSSKKYTFSEWVNKVFEFGEALEKQGVLNDPVISGFFANILQSKQESPQKNT